jgi:hypothetical protein
MKFHAEGRRIFKSAVQTDRPDGSGSISLGFPVLEVFDYVTNAEEIANAVAEALSKSDAF